MKNFSVLISIYQKENPLYLRQAFESLQNQTLQPTETVLVFDGPLTEELYHEVTLLESKNFTAVKKVPLKDNVGLGLALAEGIKHCSYEIICRMDTDDICALNRFEKQVSFIYENDDIAVVGAHLEEFRITPGDTGIIKKVPTSYAAIKGFSRFRNPLNHPTVVFRKSVLNTIGSYQSMPLFEDYYLWLRILKSGYKIQNIDRPLVHFRVANNALIRRHGFAYLKKEWNFFLTCLKENLLPAYIVLSMFIVRLPLRLLPKQIFLNFYKNFLRA